MKIFAQKVRFRSVTIKVIFKTAPRKEVTHGYTLHDKYDPNSGDV